MGRGIRRLEGGGVRVKLSMRERDLLRSLPAQLEPILRGGHDPAGVRERLFPTAYEDADAEAEYRSLVGEELTDERIGAVHAFAETLEAGATRRQTWQVELDSDEAHAWLSALNDTRLVLAAVAGVTSEDAWDRIGYSDDPTSVVLWHVSALQEELITALMGGLGGGST